MDQFVTKKQRAAAPPANASPVIEIPKRVSLPVVPSDQGLPGDQGLDDDLEDRDAVFDEYWKENEAKRRVKLLSNLWTCADVVRLIVSAGRS